MLRAIVIACAGFAVVEASAAEVVNRVFQVEFEYDGTAEVRNDPLVPNLPGDACYYWFLQFETVGPEALTIVQTLTLPAPAEAWIGYKNEPGAPLQVKADGQSAVVTMTQTPGDEGWLSDGWCVSEGDPNGAHSMVLEMDGAELGRFDFDVVAPEDYPFAEPAPPPPPPPGSDPAARSVDRSW